VAAAAVAASAAVAAALGPSFARKQQNSCDCQGNNLQRMGCALEHVTTPLL
jgi:hypothetical protein